MKAELFDDRLLATLAYYDITKQNEDNPQLAPLKQQWSQNATAQSLPASQAGHVYFISAYLCRALPGAIGTELLVNELVEQVQ